jgi:6-phosphogluconolactonase (cycloisomerase 2 family)
MIVNPAGSFLYAASNNLGGTLDFAQFQIASSGTLTPVSTLHTNVFSGNNFAITPNGATLYWSLYVGPQVVTFAVDPATGNLTQGATVTCDCFSPVGADVGGEIEVNPQGTLLVEGTQGETNPGGGLAFYRIDPATGSLTQITFKSVGSPGSPFFTLDQSGNFLYAADAGLTSIQGYAVSSGGTLTPVPGSPFPQAGGGLIMVNVQP